MGGVVSLPQENLNQDRFVDEYVLQDAETGRRAPHKFIVVRLDGRSFSHLTRNLVRPDARFSSLMCDVAEHVAKETKSALTYTHSDEITLVLHNLTPSTVFFSGKYQKLCSVIASMASVRFNKLLPERIPELKDAEALFDCRAWSLTTPEDVLGVLRWRQADCIRNAIPTTALSVLGGKIIKSGTTCKELLDDEDVRNAWRQQPQDVRYGTFIRFVKLERPLSPNRLQSIPEPHRSAVQGRTFSRTVAKRFFVDVNNDMEHEKILYNILM